ncbi:hypothetical protein VTK56DRAFT_9762 [Thermocarpiscus australiensis]
MWDRLKTTPRHVKEVGGPLDDDDDRIRMGLGYGTQAASKGYSYIFISEPPSPRPPREFLESYYVTAPTTHEPPLRSPNRITLRTSSFRPASSVYSEGKHSATVATKYGYRYRGADEISPPSSPEPDLAGTGRFSPGDVSPIDEDDLDLPTVSRYAVPPSTAISRNVKPNPTSAPEIRQGALRPPQSRGAASIPTMRRERRKHSDAATRGPVQQQSRSPPARAAPRWDPLTGERTSSSHDRPSQVQPVESAQGLGITSHAWASPQCSPTAAPPSFGERVRRIAKKAAAVKEGSTDPAAVAFTSTRPGWRGASGRTAIVDPVYDNPEVAPLSIPEKSSKRNIPSTPGAGSKLGITLNGRLRRGQTPPTNPPATETATRTVSPSQHSPAVTQPQSQSGQRYPSPPLSGNALAGDAPTVAARELARDGLAGVSTHPNPTFNANQTESTNAIRRKPPAVHANHQHQVSLSSVYSQQTDAPQPSPPQIPQATQPAAPSEEPWVQPPSRFSITTYATSNTGTTRDELDDHIDDDQPPVPSLPAGLQSGAKAGRPSNNNSPVASPIDQFMTSPFASDNNARAASPADPTQSTPTHPAIARAQTAEQRPRSRGTSDADINKTLPPAPPEASAGEAQDRVALLNARLRALANRRLNLNRCIKQMTELMPTDKLLNSEEVVRRRDAEKRKVEALRQELSDVQREEHELGLKLHRAYKRLDREAEWEPTTLWVRRVTG